MPSSLADHGRRAVALLVAISIASAPLGARADVSLPPPPAKRAAELPPPPKAGASTAGAPRGGGGGGGGGGAGGGGGGGARSPERTTALVVLGTGGVITLVGTVLLIVGAGIRPDGKSKRGDTGLLVGGAVTTGVGLGVAGLGLWLLMRSNDGKIPGWKQLTAGGAPTLRAPTWAAPEVAAAGGLVLPLGGTF